jgi:transposase
MNETARIVRMYVREQKSSRDIAAIMGLGDATIRRRLKAAGIPARSNARRSRLRKLDQAALFASIEEIGVNRTAKRFKIIERTLRYYLAGLRKAGKAEDENK